MILYNTLIGICSALVLFLSASALKTYGQGSSLVGHGFALVTVSLPLSLLSAAMTLKGYPALSIVFGQPTLMLGALGLVAGYGLARGYTERPDFNLKPFTWIISAVGLALLALATAIFRFDLVGNASTSEPIIGQADGWQNIAFGVAYLLAAIGCLVAVKVEEYWAYAIIRFSWIATGIFLLAFSVLNFYTRVGLLTNIGTGSDFKW